MNIKFERDYRFRVKDANLEQIHTDISNLLRVLPDSIYDELLICIHELIINSIAEMKAMSHRNDLITIYLLLTEENAILCLKDHGRGISKSELENREQNPLKEKGRGLDIIMMLSDWFCIYLENNYYSYYVIKKYTH